MSSLINVHSRLFRHTPNTVQYYLWRRFNIFCRRSVQRFVIMKWLYITLRLDLRTNAVAPTCDKCVQLYYYGCILSTTLFLQFFFCRLHIYALSFVRCAVIDYVFEIQSKADLLLFSFSALK